MTHNSQDTNVNAFHALDQLQRDREARSQSLGDIRQIYDTCGMMGLCPECRRKGIVELHMGCQRHYVAGRVRGEPDP